MQVIWWWASLFLVENDLPLKLNIIKLDGKTEVKCFLCNKVFHLKYMRNHVGIHLLKAFRQHDDPLLDETMDPEVVGLNH
jgi:hypothetical protein